MFSLDKHTVKITHASLTAENHGKDSHATGMTLKFKTNIDAGLLDSFRQESAEDDSWTAVPEGAR
jgi:hypothetical protein